MLGGRVLFGKLACGGVVCTDDGRELLLADTNLAAPWQLQSCQKSPRLLEDWTTPHSVSGKLTYQAGCPALVDKAAVMDTFVDKDGHFRQC